jgi:hypothetical protein
VGLVDKMGKESLVAFDSAQGFGFSEWTVLSKKEW